MGKMLWPTIIFDWIFFILQATRTPINSLIGSKFGQIGPLTVELAALERLENLNRLKWEKCCDYSSAFNFEWIFFIFADMKDNCKSLG